MASADRIASRCLPEGDCRARCRSDLHEMNQINTYVSPRGLRVCRACARANTDARKAAA